MMDKFQEIQSLARKAIQAWTETSKNGVNYAAKPYLDALAYGDISDGQYGYDSVGSVITYALCNMSSFRGTDARQIKARLKELAK